jgi:DNA-binding HxlR family transcriptional regulator
MKKTRGQKSDKRSKCPISCTLELVGDKWSLLIIRDMLFLEKSTYNEFLESGEKISTNILNDRLITLTEKGLITYTGAAKRKKYTLTKMGRDLKPIVDAVGMFGMKYFEGSKEYVQKQLRDAGK